MHDFDHLMIIRRTGTPPKEEKTVSMRFLMILDLDCNPVSCTIWEEVQAENSECVGRITSHRELPVSVFQERKQVYEREKLERQEFFILACFLHPAVFSGLRNISRKFFFFVFGLVLYQQRGLFFPSLVILVFRCIPSPNRYCPYFSLLFIWYME